MLPTLILLVLIYLLYRSLRPGRPWFQVWLQNKLREKAAGTFYGTSRGTSAPPKTGKVIDEMKACPNCGTYNPSQLAYVQKDLYFCNRECHASYQKNSVS